MTCWDEEMTCSQNDLLTNDHCTNDSWRNDKLTKWSFYEEMTNWQDDHFMKQLVDKMFILWNDQQTKWSFYEMTSWQNDHFM